MSTATLSSSISGTRNTVLTAARMRIGSLTINIINQNSDTQYTISNGIDDKKLNLLLKEAIVKCVKNKIVTSTSNNKSISCDIEEIKSLLTQEISNELVTPRENPQIKSDVDDIKKIVEVTHTLHNNIFQKIDKATNEQKQAVQKLFSQYMSTAEKRYTDIMGKLSTKHQSLDWNVLINMQKNMNVLLEKISQNDFDSFQSSLDNIYQNLDRMESTVNDTFKTAQENKSLLQDIVRALTEMSQTCDSSDSHEISNPMYQEKIITLSQNIANLKEKIAAYDQELLNFDKVNSTCPFCGFTEQRILISGRCECKICGKHFIGIDFESEKFKSMDEQTQQQLNAEKNQNIEDAQRWRQKHTAILEGIGKLPGAGIYRMKLDEKQDVSSTGVLFLPVNPDFGSSAMKKSVIASISFCEPNTDDLKSQMLCKEKVKTLIVPSRLTLEARNKIVPFSFMEHLEKVLTYSLSNDTKICTSVEDSMLLNQIKQR